MKIKKRFLTGAVLVAMGVTITLSAAACTATTATTRDQNTTNHQLSTYEQSQPIPYNTWSQYRQTVIDVEQAEVHGVATTSFFYNMGSNVPYKTCPSIGFPVASTAQLTNPDQVTDGQGPNTGSGNVTIAQAEPNGVYTGTSTGTYVVCVQPDGTKRIDYAEGFVHTEGGAAHYDKTSGMIVDDGGTTVNSKGK